MSQGASRFVEAHGRALLLIVPSFVLAGAVFIFRLPISIFPQTDFPRLVILVDNGIAPVDVQMLTVTRPIEEAIRIVPGITDIRSVTARGSTEISAFFRWDVDILNALHLVQGRISQIAPSLPPGSRFYINRLTFSVFPMIGFSITSPNRSLSELWDLAYYDLAPRLYRLPGVAETRIVGGSPPEYHVIVNPEKLNAYGLPLTKVSDAIRNSNLIEAAGMMQENYHLYLTTVTGLVRQPKQIEDMVVDVVKGTPVLIKDLANVVPAERPVYNISDGQRANCRSGERVAAAGRERGGDCGRGQPGIAEHQAGIAQGHRGMASKGERYGGHVNQTIVIGPSVNFRVDMEKAERAGFGVKDVASLEAAILDGELVSNMIRGNRLVGIRVRYPAEYRSATEKLQSLLLTSPTGQTVPLSSVSIVEMEEGRTEIHRDNLCDLSSVTARLAGRDLGSGMAEIQSRLFKEVDIRRGLTSSSEAFTRSSANRSWD